MSIFVGNLPFRAEQEDISELFSPFGEVTSCALPLERDTGRKRGFAFVEMADEEAETKAIDALQGAELMGRPLRINKAEPRATGGGGGGYGGGGARRSPGGYGGGGSGAGGGGGYGGAGYSRGGDTSYAGASDRGASDRGSGARGSGARGWEDRSYGGGAPAGDSFDAGRTRRRRSAGGGGGEASGGGYGGSDYYGGAEG